VDEEVERRGAQDSQVAVRGKGKILPAAHDIQLLSSHGGRCHPTSHRACGGGLGDESEDQSGGDTGGGGSFTQTFTIDANTKVVGKGVGTAAAAKGGKAPFEDLIANGDRVSVSYHTMGDTLHASDVRVTMKGSGTR
jgi:hypothetical protein